MKKRKGPEPIPSFIVTEMMGSVRFTRNSQRDVQIAEEIASQSYDSMDDLMKTIQGYIENPKLRACFKEECTTYPQNSFYAPYFKTNP